MAKYYLVTGGIGYAGCNFEEVLVYPDEITEIEVSEDAHDLVEQYAESYSHIHFGWNEEYTEEEWDFYLENYVDFNYQELTREEYLEYCHDNDMEPEF